MPAVIDCRLAIKQSSVGNTSTNDVPMGSSSASVVPRLVSERFATIFRSVPVFAEGFSSIRRLIHEWLLSASHVVSIDPHLAVDGLAAPFDEREPD